MQNNIPTVFVADDEESVRHSLTWLLQSISVNVQAYPSAQVFLDTGVSCSYGCLITDVRMPGMSGLQFQDALIEKDFGLPIIFLSAYGDAQMGAQAIKKGAIDFLQKPYRNQDLVDAVNAALQVSKDRLDKQDEKSDAADCFQTLSQRERGVLDLVVAGKSSKVIAQALGISPKTVEAHRARIMSKLGVRSSADLIHLSLRHNSNSHCRQCKWHSVSEK